MADITNAQIVTFVKEKLRPTADSGESFYETARRFQLEWAVLVASSAPPNTSDKVADGADQDGRKPVTGQLVNGVKAQIIDPLVAWFDGPSGFGSLSRIEVLRRVSVNGQGKF